VSDELVKSVSITNLLQQREAVLDRVRQAQDLLLEARSIALAAHLVESDGHRDFLRLLRGGNSYAVVPLLEGDFMASTQKRVDAAAWSWLMHESGLRTFMDTDTRARWDKQIDVGDTPEMTPDNIRSTFQGLYAQRASMFEQGVLSVFNRLSHNYKTNSPVRFGLRIIKRLGWGGHFEKKEIDPLEDLQRVFCVLDGQPEEDHRQGLFRRLYAHHGESRGVLCDRYMKIRWHKNGSGHISFLRPDLVERLNAILVKHYPNALPPPASGRVD
jgi:hypothetical protein